MVATLGREPFLCLVCRGEVFFQRAGMLSSRGGWDLKPAIELICRRCGHVHGFVQGATECPIEVWPQDFGYPSSRVVEEL